jgi:hypothetical protein
MAWRTYIRVTDRTTAGGFVIGGIDGTDHMGQRLSHLFAEVWCPACETHGVIVPDGDRPDDDWTGQKPALNFDICKCKCDPPPRLIASDLGMQVWVEPPNDANDAGGSPLGYAIHRSSGVGRTGARHNRLVRQNKPVLHKQCASD